MEGNSAGLILHSGPLREACSSQKNALDNVLQLIEQESNHHPGGCHCKVRIII